MNTSIYNRQANIPKIVAELERDIADLKTVQPLGRDILRPKVNVTGQPYDVLVDTDDGFFVIYQNFVVKFTAAHQTSPWATLRMEIFANDPSTPATESDIGLATASFDPAASEGGVMWWVCQVTGPNTLSALYVKLKVFATDTGTIEVILT